MIANNPHTGFIVAAYAVATIVIGAMIVGTVLDYRGLKQRLKKFGPRGLRE